MGFRQAPITQHTNISNNFSIFHINSNSTPTQFYSNLIPLPYPFLEAPELPLVDGNNPRDRGDIPEEPDDRSPANSKPVEKIVPPAQLLNPAAHLRKRRRLQSKEAHSGHRGGEHGQTQQQGQATEGAAAAFSRTTTGRLVAAASGAAAAAG